MLLHDIPRELGAYTLTEDMKNSFRAFRQYFDLPIQIRVVNNQIVDGGFLDIEGIETGVENTWYWWGTPTAQWLRSFQERTAAGIELPEFNYAWIERVIYESA